MADIPDNGVKVLSVEALTGSLKVLEGVIERSESVDKSQSLGAIEYARKWCVRRGLTFSDDHENQKLRRLLNLNENPVKPTVSLDAGFVEYLQTYFLDALPHEHYLHDSGISEGYSNSLCSAMNRFYVDDSGASKAACRELPVQIQHNNLPVKFLSHDTSR